MRLWRLSNVRYAREFDGGYGLAFNGRWNTIGRAVTYCSTVPSLCALEKRVHFTDPDLLPEQIMVEYEAPEDLAKGEIRLADLPADWTGRVTHTQRLGDDWLDQRSGVLLVVPSAVVPIATAPDRNVLINHRHAGAARIEIVDAVAFTLDPRLFAL
jgi:RES domain-containing protein